MCSTQVLNFFLFFFFCLASSQRHRPTQKTVNLKWKILAFKIKNFKNLYLKYGIIKKLVNCIELKLKKKMDSIKFLTVSPLISGQLLRTDHANSHSIENASNRSWKHSLVIAMAIKFKHKTYTLFSVSVLVFSCA